MLQVVASELLSPMDSESRMMSRGGFFLLPSKQGTKGYLKKLGITNLLGKVMKSMDVFSYILRVTAPKGSIFHLF